MHRSFIVVLGIGLAAFACGGDEPGSATSPMKMKDTEGTTDVPMDTSTGDGADVPGDRCEAPIEARPGLRTGTLVNAQSDAGGACGRGGPEVFVKIEIDRRADLRVEAFGEGFVPIVGVLESCADWAEARLACAEGVPTTVLDLAAGAAPIVAVGIRDDDPVLADDASGREFALDLQIRAVLAAGEACMPADRGRCETGSACLPDDEGVEYCTVLPADTCATAEPHTIALGETIAITVDPNVPQTDAHAHQCVGARRRDRVLRLALPDVLPKTTALRVETNATDVGVAVRGASCSVEDELGCAPPDADGLALVVPDLAVRLGSDRAPYVFVELPLDDDEIDPGELPPFELTIELVGP